MSYFVNCSGKVHQNWIWNEKTNTVQKGGLFDHLVFITAMHSHSTTWLQLFRAVGNGEAGALCIEMAFYADISWKSGCDIKTNVWAHFYTILLVFEVPYWLQVKGKLKLSKVGKGSDIDRIVCVIQIGLKFYNNELRFISLLHLDS